MSKFNPHTDGTPPEQYFKPDSKDQLIAALTEEVENQRQAIQNLSKMLAEAEEKARLHIALDKLETEGFSVDSGHDRGSGYYIELFSVEKSSGSFYEDCPRYYVSRVEAAEAALDWCENNV